MKLIPDQFAFFHLVQIVAMRELENRVWEKTFGFLWNFNKKERKKKKMRHAACGTTKWLYRCFQRKKNEPNDKNNAMRY